MTSVSSARSFFSFQSKYKKLVTEKQSGDQLKIMENNSIFQPLLSDYNEDQILNFQQTEVTTGTSFQPLYGPEQSGNALVGM